MVQADALSSQQPRHRLKLSAPAVDGVEGGIVAERRAGHDQLTVRHHLKIVLPLHSGESSQRGQVTREMSSNIKLSPHRPLLGYDSIWQGQKV